MIFSVKGIHIQEPGDSSDVALFMERICNMQVVPGFQASLLSQGTVIFEMLITLFYIILPALSYYIK